MISCEFLDRLQEFASTGSECLLSAQASWLCLACGLVAARELFCVCVHVCVGEHGEIMSYKVIVPTKTLDQ